MHKAHAILDSPDVAWTDFTLN